MGIFDFFSRGNDDSYEEEEQQEEQQEEVEENFSECSHCGQRFEESELIYESGEGYFCESCHDELFVECTDCGAVLGEGDERIQVEDGYLCESCAQAMNDLNDRSEDEWDDYLGTADQINE